jgi:hypothetical protein
MCAEWRAARAQQQKNWAEHELAAGWGYLPDKGIELSLEPLDKMHELEYHLSRTEPRTILLARELLGVCVTILAHETEDPEHILAQGPVLDIVRNVIKSLDTMNGDMPIGASRRRKAKPRPTA